jgi:5-methylcytosine-specific restriction endonuclease McrA
MKNQREEYREYLASPLWAFKRAGALARDGYRCRLCNSKVAPLHVHHRTYDRFGHEDLNDLTTLCEKCHNAFHRPPKALGPKAKKSRRKTKPSELSPPKSTKPAVCTCPTPGLRRRGYCQKCGKTVEPVATND